MRSITNLSTSLIGAVVAIFLLVAPGFVQAQKYKFKVLHTFHGKDGALPFSQLVRDAAGNLYGTTSNGGSGECFGVSCGTVFKMDKTGKLIWSYSFHGSDGFLPDAGVFRDTKGNLYGTTVAGGILTCPLGGGDGCGVVFKLDTALKETVLHKFNGDCNGNEDGSSPESAPVMDAAGNLYGTTNGGGPPFRCGGVVFKVSSAGKERTLYTFQGKPDGSGAGLGLIRRGAHTLYGTTGSGGSFNQGAVFRISTSGNESVLYSFTGVTDGDPASVLASDRAGNLYGTTRIGGSNCGSGCGTVFKLSPSGGNWTRTTLYVFCQLTNCVDGWTPLNGPLVLDKAGNIYGTTAEGGIHTNCNSYGTGCGTVFKLDPSGHETVLYSFTGKADGVDPGAGVTMDDSGNLYGTTQVGGDLKYSVGHTQGCGTVFELTPVTE